MIDAMRSLINTSIDQFRAPPVQAEETARARPQPQSPKTYTPNAAVEVTLSPQAQAILKALEANDITPEQLQQAGERQQQAAQEKSRQPQDANSDAIALPDGSAPNPALPHSLPQDLTERLNAIAEEFGLPEFDEETAESLSLLFREVQISLQPAEGGEAATPVSSADGMLSPVEQMKVAALYAELDRLLGGGGVFFGGDHLTQRLNAQDQVRARELKAGLDQTLAQSAGRNLPLGLTAPQEARVDAILREIGQLYAKANDENSEARKRAVDGLLGGDGGGQIAAGGAGLDA